MGIEGLFELNATRLGQLQRALLLFSKNLIVNGSVFAFLTKNELACLARLAESQKFRNAHPVVSFKDNHVSKTSIFAFLHPKG